MAVRDHCSSQKHLRVYQRDSVVDALRYVVEEGATIEECARVEQVDEVAACCDACEDGVSEGYLGVGVVLGE